ncbi:MAG: hypothetical protein AAF622_04005 [Cyanobacteria bacterium P01_C01_bin.147]
MTPAQSFLMVPDSISDRILLFDPVDGSLIDDNFIDGSDAGLGIFGTPINAIQVNREIWVSDQAADAIFRFDLTGQYLGIVNDGDGDGDTDGLDNVRGIEFVNNLIYVANAGDGNEAPGDGEVVVVFDPEGNNLGFFDTGDPFDIRAYNGTLLISDINSESDGGEDIDRYTLDGINSTFDETFVESDGVTGIDFPQQISVRASNANLLVGGFSAPGGFYEYDLNGNQVDLLDAEDGFANRVRAAYELANGNILWSGGDGVVVTDPTTGADTDIYTVNTLDFRPSARYIEQLVVPKPGALDLTGAIFLGDQGLDKIFLTQDLTGDGDANDPLEVAVYFDGTNASGFASPTGNVLTIFQSPTGLFYGDGDTDSVYRLLDLNEDGDALDAGEASLWFGDSPATPLPTPNGIAQGSDDAIYIVNAGTRSSPADAVYRTQDLNGDGDALDSGESAIWLDLQTLNPSSSAFDIEFIGDVAYISDLVGGDDDVIYRAEDRNGNNVIDEGEANVFIQDGNAFGVPLDFGIAVDEEAVYTWESLDFAGPQSVYRLSDQNGSGSIDAANEAVEVWNTDALPVGFEVFSGFSIALGPDKELVITSNGRDAEDNLFRLVDTNGDGDYLDAAETIPYLATSLTGIFPERPRSVEYAQSVPILEIGLFDAQTNRLITRLQEGSEVLLSEVISKDITISTLVPDASPFAGQVESMILDLNQGQFTRTENIKPYALFGDNNGKFQGQDSILALGSNEITFDLYSKNRGRGDLLASISRNFTVVDDITGTIGLSVGLYDADTDVLITPLSDGDTVLASDIADRNLTLAAFLPNDDLVSGLVESMVLNLNEGQVVQTENFEPYALFGDGNGDFRGSGAGLLSLGANSIGFDLYSENRGQGNLLQSETLTFTVVEDLVEGS